MRLAHPAGLGLLALAIPVILMHVLRPRRPPVTVNSTWLWQEVAKPVSSATPWQRLRVTPLLVLQLLAVVLLALAAATPVRPTDAPLARHTVFVVDTSGSMAAADGHPDRLSDARRAASRLRRQLPAGGRASLVDASAQPRVLVSASPDPRAFSDALGTLRAGGGRADFAAAFTLAASLETPDAPLGIVLVSDGGLTDEEKALLPAGTRYVKVGSRATNRAVTRLAAEQQGSGLRAFVTARNTGGGAATATVRVDVDGRTAARQQVRLAAGATAERTFDLPAGERVEAFLDGNDLLAADDHAVAVAGRRRSVRVVVMGAGDPFLDRLLAALPGVTVERRAGAGPAPGADLAVYDGVAVPPEPGAPFLAVAPPGGAPGIAVTGAVERPAVTLVRTEHPLLQGLDLSDVAVATAQKVSAPGDDVLVAAADGSPLLVHGTRGGLPFAYLAFALADSDLPLQVAFPVLGDRLVADLAGATAPATDLRVGDLLPVSGGVKVRRPGGSVLAVPPEGPAPVADRPGFWVVTQTGRPDRLLAVNPDPAESSLRPAASLPVPKRPAGERGPATGGESPLLAWVAAALAAALVAEWLLARRGVGVGAGQWRAAVAARAVVAALVLGALVGLAVPRTGRGVATVFLIDASDSVGPSGTAEGVQWVRRALAGQPAGARAGVALFGGDARLELTVQHDATFVGPSVKIDSTRTDLAGALRLAAAVLPADARRRVVVVSDGRLTDGDAATEAARLRAAGIEVDVHTVARRSGADAAVASLAGPSRARVGESVVLEARVTATTAGPARVVLQRDGTAVEERAVDLAAGDTTVSFAVPATEAGLSRYRVQVLAAGDTQPANDVGFTAVEVQGPARVLVAEGRPGEAAALAAALKAAGLQVDTVASSALPALDTLAGYQATVLVDVDAASLGDDQVRALTAATRDLGHGLVTVGGDRAYALGGYLGSPLEQLLPVISDVTDPKRRASVAQVLAIDTSGSMAACHCAEGAGANGMVAGGNRGEGGVNKTDISRAAARRAIDALSADDQVGVLAFNTEQRFVVPLQKRPPDDVVDKGLGGLSPAGGTDLPAALARAAQELRSAKARLKHIILFTDGFTSQEALSGMAATAGQLADEGITVSVLATGEGASTELAAVAEAGRGRFYAGRDLSEIPQILQQEAVLASRSFVNEGEFLPEVTAGGPATDGLTSAPPLFGYVASTARPTATTALRIGDEHDPLLASWRVGLGRATSWTSDASARWSQAWAGWGGYARFWAAVVKDTFPDAGSGAGSVQARVDGDRLRIVVEGEAEWPADATAVARVAGPDLQGRDVELERASGTTFVGEVPAARPGVYGVGATVTTPAGTLLAATGLASQSYGPEYRPGPAQGDVLVAISRRSGGRGEIRPAQAFDARGLRAGRGRVPLAGWLLLAAALLWPVAVALGRLTVGRAAVVGVGRRVGAAARRVRPPPRWGRPTDARRPPPPAGPPPPDGPAPGEQAPEPARRPPATVDRLLQRKRQSAGDDGG